MKHAWSVPKASTPALQKLTVLVAMMATTSKKARASRATARPAQAPIGASPAKTASICMKECAMRVLLAAAFAMLKRAQNAMTASSKTVPYVSHA